jgi:hypothetical protein
MKSLVIVGWAVTVAIVVFMIRDVIQDLEQAPWAVKAGLGMPANMALLVGIVGLISTIIYLLPQTSVSGAILLTGFFGGAVVIHLKVNGDLFDIGENILVGAFTWAGLWMRDSRVRALLLFRLTLQPFTMVAKRP